MSSEGFFSVIPIPLSVLKKHRNPPHLVHAQAQFGGIPVPVPPILLEYVLAVADSPFSISPDIDAFLEEVYRATIVAPVHPSAQKVQGEREKRFHDVLEELCEAHKEAFKPMEQHLAVLENQIGLLVSRHSSAPELASHACDEPCPSSAAAAAKEDTQLPLPKTTSTLEPAAPSTLFPFSFSQPIEFAKKDEKPDTASQPRPQETFSTFRPFKFGPSNSHQEQAQANDPCGKLNYFATRTLGKPSSGKIGTKRAPPATDLKLVKANATKWGSKLEDAGKNTLVLRDPSTIKPLPRDNSAASSSETKDPHNAPSNSRASANTKTSAANIETASQREPTIKDLLGHTVRAGGGDKTELNDAKGYSLD